MYYNADQGQMQTMNDYFIRTCESKDLQDILDIELNTPGDLTYSYLILRQLFDICGVYFKVAVSCDKDIMGYVICSPTVGRRDAWILSLAVLPNHWHKGIGTNLTLDICKQLLADEINHVLLTVNPVNTRAISLYNSLGFQPISLEVAYFGDGHDRIIMQKSLK
jgi:ribosomal protein S18 acetylase RimI-like enzyme